MTIQSHHDFRVAPNLRVDYVERARTEKAMDETKQSKRGRGRPSLSGCSGNSPTMNVRLAQADLDKLRKVATDKGCTVSALIQTAIKALIK